MTLTTINSNSKISKHRLKFLEKPKTLIRIGIISLCLGILYFSVFKSMVQDWINLPDYSHGFFIPFIALYLVWDRSDKLDTLPVLPNNAGIIILLSGLFLLLVGNLAAESFTMRFSFLFVLAGIILFLLGWPHLKALLFPVLFLIFMIPIPSILMVKITFPMQLFASRVATESLQLFGIPVLREGNIIHLAHTTLDVAEACSGIRSLISLLALGTIFAYLTQKVFWKRVVLVLSCFPIAIVVNALRVSATGILANHYGIKAAEGFFHGFSGYLLFIFAFMLMFLTGTLLGKLQQ